MSRNVINIQGVSEPEGGGQPKSELGGQLGRNTQQLASKGLSPSSVWDFVPVYSVLLYRMMFIQGTHNGYNVHAPSVARRVADELVVIPPIRPLKIEEKGINFFSANQFPLLTNRYL